MASSTMTTRRPSWLLCWGQRSLHSMARAGLCMGAFLEANHPRMLHFEIYIDDDANEMTVVQIHPDEDSVLLHLKLAGQQIAGAYEFLEATTVIDIYGTPSDALVDQIRQMGMGAPVRFHVAAAGFSRLASVGV
jgi:hypothetical protein